MRGRPKSSAQILVVAVVGCVASVAIGAVVWAAKKESGTISHSLTVDGRTHSYLLHLPSARESGKPLPIVIVLHGGGQSPESAERMSGMSALADRDNFLAVYPSGTLSCRLRALNHWEKVSLVGLLATALPSWTTRP